MAKTEAYTLSDLEEIAGVGQDLLDLSRVVHDELAENGQGGEYSGRLNQYQEQQLVVDYEIERRLREFIQDSPDSGRNWLIRSEEFSPTIVHPSRPIEGIFVIDGADGSSAAQKYLHGDESALAMRYATMVAAAPGDDPLYGDFVFGGVNEHALNRKTYAIAGQGASMETPEGRFVPIHAAPVEELTRDTHVYAFDEPLFERFNTDPSVLEELKSRGIPRSRLLSSASHWVDLASGATEVIDANGEIVRRPLAAVVETSRKGMEEWPVAAVFSGAGFSLKTRLENGKVVDLSTRRFLEQQQPIGEPTIRGRVIVGSPSPRIARELAAA